MVTALVLLSAVGPLVTRHGPLESDFVHGASSTGGPVGPDLLFWLGADGLFRDVLARLAFAARLSLFASIAATALSVAIGATVGVTAGWYAGEGPRLPWPALAGAAGAIATAALGAPRIGAAMLAAGLAAAAARRFAGARVDVDGLLMRAVDVMLAFPFLLLVMAIGAALERTSAVTILFTLGVTGWLGVARVLRAKTMQVRSCGYVLASRALGQSTPKILVKHVLPNIAGPLVVTATTLVAQMVVADSALSYLGVGVSPPTPTLGRMLYEGQDDAVAAPWLVAAPGIAILLAVWGFNLLGEGLRDALDPREA